MPLGTKRNGEGDIPVCHKIKKNRNKTRCNMGKSHVWVMIKVYFVFAAD